MKCFLDTETCGLTGPAVIIQYAFDDGPIEIHEFWREPVSKTLELLEKISYCEVVGFNLAFDWFQLHKIFNMFLLCDDKSMIPEDMSIDGWAYREQEALDGPCFKPYKACDLMLHARKTKYQVTMERNDIRIRRVPTALAFKLAEELEKRLIFDSILFARRKDDTQPRWSVYDITRADGKTDASFKDVVLKFKPSVALKALAQDALGETEDSILLFSDIEVDKRFRPKELKYAPYALAVGSPGNWRGAWPDVIHRHISHWAYHEDARHYARKDVDFTRRLYEYFGNPLPGDDDSELACMVASCRLRGYKVDLGRLEKQKQEEKAKLGKYPTDPRRAKAMLFEKLSPPERAVLQRGTGKVILEEIASMANQECPFGPCEECNDTGRLSHPAGEVAKGILDARKAVKRIELYDKLLLARRLHASFKVIGTLSSRMSGTDDLNPQGISHAKDVRAAFPLALDPLDLWGGDFDGFEVTLADAAYNDPKLREDLLSGKKIHGLFAMSLYPGKTYAEIVASKGDKDLDMYDMGKRGVFALMYGGNAATLVSKLGVSIEVAEATERRFMKSYPGVGKAREKVFGMFCSMRQPGGIGSKVEWNEPSEFIESLFGFRRYFTLENNICRVLFDLANDPPKDWRKINIKVVRRDREQLASGAVRSALFAAAFGIQSANMRAAANHVIQSSGAQVTKRVQRKIWDLQPCGSHVWKVQPMNIHDEILCPTSKDMVEIVTNTVNETVEQYKERVPLMQIGWQRMNSWAEK